MCISTQATMSPSDEEAAQPLLHDEDHQHASSSSSHAYEDNRSTTRGVRKAYHACQQRIQNFLSSRAQHYTVLGLVTCDLLGIFADIIISLSLCEGNISGPHWGQVRNGLGIAGLVFSCMFMVELILSVWAFGWRYFNSYFHCFDGTVIVAGFIVDVLLHGVLEEVASLVVVLRLWRFFKIIEE